MIYDLQPRRAVGAPKRKRVKAAHWIEAIFLFTGLACLLVVGIWLLQTKAYQAYDRYQFEQKISKPSSAEVKKVREPGSMIGRIEIPRVGVSAMMQEGVDNGTLSRAVGHVPSTPVPGEPGNVGVAAHRDSFFRGLRNIRLGDRIEVTTEEGRFFYLVESTSVVAPENVEVLDPTPTPAITLVTCYPFNYIGSAPKRFIVRAKMLTGDGTSAAAKPSGPRGAVNPARKLTVNPS